MNVRSPAGFVDRRRFLAISGAALGLGIAGDAALAAIPVHRWRGVALGARAEIRLYHPDGEAAARLLASAEAEIRRLEGIFSLYRADSAISRLNRDGRLTAPPLDMVDLLGLSARLHRDTRGAFDPSIQPLWRFYAEWFASRGGRSDGDTPSPGEIRGTLRRVGFTRVHFDAREIRFARPGMALTLNGIAQGFITDRISALLRAGGVSDILVDLGEIGAFGSPNGGGDGWSVRLDPDRAAGQDAERVDLVDRCVASSAIRGTTFDAGRRVGHILDPRTGRPAQTGLLGASVVAPSAAVADGLSTAALICGRAALAEILDRYPDTSARLLDKTGRPQWIAG